MTRTNGNPCTYIFNRTAYDQLNRFCVTSAGKPLPELASFDPRDALRHIQAYVRHVSSTTVHATQKGGATISAEQDGEFATRAFALHMVKEMEADTDPDTESFEVTVEMMRPRTFWETLTGASEPSVVMCKFRIEPPSLAG